VIVDTVGLWNQGRKAALAGKTKSSCPYKSKDLRTCWQAGWDSGKEERDANPPIQPR
jgi:ribosome modulation factor